MPSEVSGLCGDQVVENGVETARAGEKTLSYFPTGLPDEAATPKAVPEALVGSEQGTTLIKKAQSQETQ
jgi:hypothetical protein